MPNDTPLTEVVLHDGLTVETVSDVEPRLRTFSQSLIIGLRAAGVDVTTGQVFLLNSSQHMLEVPVFCNTIPIQMNFDAAVRVGQPGAKARLCVRFDNGPRYLFSERGKPPTSKFPMRRVLKRFLQEIVTVAHTQKVSSTKAQKVAQAKRLMAELSAKLGVAVDASELNLSTEDFRVKGLPQIPTHVLVLLKMTHQEAETLLRERGLLTT